MELSNEARSLILDTERLRMSEPCPLDGWDALGQLAVIAVMMGTEAGVEYYRLLQSELEERKGARAGTERYRLLWMHLKPYYNSEIEDILKRAGARLVCEEYDRCFWKHLDPDNPFDSLAGKIMGNPGAGTAAARAADLVRLAREYRVDGAVHFSHRGCRQSSGGAQLVKDELSRAGVRTLVLDGDCVDPRDDGRGQVRVRLEAFLETLDGAKR